MLYPKAFKCVILLLFACNGVHCLNNGLARKPPMGYNPW
jgi:hypothetical protein